MDAASLIKIGVEVAVLAISAWGAYQSQKGRADLAELKDQFKEWTYEHFMPRNEMKVYEVRLDRLEERPSNQARVNAVN